jgi:dTDP-4-amino-4,6-dideoxygalactose transaminase
MFLVGKEECEAVEKVILSKKYFRYQGPNKETITSKCEEGWNQFLEASFSLLTTSGTNSLVVGMAAFGVGPGDEVIVPAYTFVATASAVMQVGAIPIIANIDETLTLDIDDVKSKITKKTKAIVAVHMDGLVCDLSSLQEICDANGLLLVEDAAQACGGTYKGQALGTVGAFGGFSFNVDKVISCGEGGLLVIKDKKHEKAYLKSLMLHDTACQFGLSLKEKLSSLPTTFGISSRLNEINSAILSVQLKRLPEILSTLRKTKKELVKECEQLGIKIFCGHDNEGDIGTILHVVASDPLTAMDVSKKLIQKGHRAGPPYLRPAHTCWSWYGGMNSEHYFVDGLNPFKATKEEYQYKKSDYLPTVKILSETIRIEINPFENESFKDDLIKDLKEILKL